MPLDLKGAAAWPPVAHDGHCGDRAQHDAQAWAHEIVLAVPASVTDLYLLHQMVWSQVDALRAVATRPTILYRRDKGMVRVRVRDTAMRHGQAMRACFANGGVVRLTLRAALWRQVDSTRISAQQRAGELLEASGFAPREMTLQTGVAEGQKTRADEHIRLPVADIHATCIVDDPVRAAQAWATGIGRGKRFGFGMLILT